MLQALSNKIHHIVYALALTIVGVTVAGVWGYVELHRPAHATTPTSVATAVDPTREIQAVIEAGKVLAASQGPAPAFSQPAVNVIREVVPGLTPGEVAQILAGLKAPTRQVISATSKLVGPTPAPKPTAVAGLTADELAAIQQADKAAVTDVLADPQTHIATSVNVTQEEVQPTRVGSMFTVDGSGLGFAVVRRGHFEINLGAIVRGSHLSPTIQPAFLIPHTAVSVGPSLTYDHRFLAGIAASIHF